MALVKQEQIQFIGVSDLETDEKLAVTELSSEYYAKIKRQIRNLLSLVVHIKVYGKGGQKKKYAIHARVIAPTRIFESCRSHDFDLARALHKSFKDLLSEMRHALHTDVQGADRKSRTGSRKKSSRADIDVRGF